MAIHFQLLFKDLRKRIPDLMDLSDVQIKMMLQQFLSRLRETYDEPNLYGSFKNDDEPINVRRIDKYLHNANDLKEYQDILTAQIEDQMSKLALGDYADIEDDADKLLIENGIAESDIDKSSSSYAKLCSGLLREEIKGVEYHKKILSGKFIDEFQDIITNGFEKTTEPIPMPTSPPPTKTSEKTISQVMSDFFNEGEAENRWTEKTRGEIESSLKILLEILGDVPVDTITKPTMADFKKSVMKLPPNMNKDKRYKNKSIQQILVMRPKKVISVHTVNKYIG